MDMHTTHLPLACGRPGLVTEGLWGRFDVLKTPPKAESSILNAHWYDVSFTMYGVTDEVRWSNQVKTTRSYNTRFYPMLNSCR